MNENFRLIIIILIMGTVGAFLWMWTNREQTPSPATRQVANTVPAQPESTVVKDDNPIETATPETGHTEPEPEQKTGEQTNASKNSKTGRGVIKGTLTMRDKSELPQDLYTIHLHRIEEKMSTKEIKDTLVDTFETQSDGTFEIKELPLGQYIVIAYSDYLTGNSSSTLVKERKESERTIQMAPKGYLSGVVVNPQGDIIPAANVFVGGYKQNDNVVKVGELRSRGSRALTNDSGEFSIGSLQVQSPPLTYQLIALADGYAPTVSDLYPVNSTGIQIVLQKGVQLAGKVLEAETEEPRPDFSFSLSSGYALNRLDAKTNKDGSFSFDDVAPADYTVVLESKAEVISDDTRTVKVASERDVTDALIKVMLGGSIAGRLTDRDSGQGIAVASISAYPQNIENARSKQVETDKQGNYKIEGLITGSYEVRYRDVEGYPDFSYNTRKNIGITIGQTVSNVDFELSRGMTFGGRVALIDGTPVEGVNVDAYSNQGGSRDRSKTDANGKFVLAGFSPGDNVQLSASKNGYGRVRLNAFKLTEEPVDDIEITFTVESTVSGTVVDGLGNPVDGLRLFPHDVKASSYNISTNKSDASGAFKVSGMTGGTFEIHYYNDSFNHDQEPLGKFTLERGEHLTDVRLIYDLDPGLSIDGTVTDEDGKPIQYAYLNANGAGKYTSAQTDQQGKFTLTHLVEGEYRIEIQNGSYSNKTLTSIVAGTTNLQIVLDKRGTVSGTVIDGTNNAPVSEFQIQARRSDQTFQPDMNANYKNYQNPNGEFTLPNVEAGSNMIMVKAPGYTFTESTLNDLSPGGTLENIVIRLEPGARLTGTVVDQNGDPVYNAFIFDGEIPRHNQERAATTRTDRDGSFELTSLPIGSATFGVYHQKYRQEQPSLNMNPGTNTITVTLSQGGTVEGYLTVNGQPHPGGNVGYYTQQVNRNETVDENGFYQMTGLPDGMGQINSNINVDGVQRSMNHQVEIANNMTTKLDFDFASANGTIEGVVYKAENTPVAGRLNLSVVLQDGSSESRYSEIGSDGYFSMEGLPAGTVKLSVYIPGMSNKTVEVELGEGESVWKDINLFGGATVNIQLLNAPTTTFPVGIMVVSGHVSLPEPLTMETYMPFAQSMVTQVQSANNQATISNLDPGNYTFFAYTYTQQPSQDDPFGDIIWAIQQVTVQERKEQFVEMRFEQ
jgi:hypothetical protein